MAAEVDGGGSVREVARRHGLRAGTLSWWCWRLRRDGSAGRRSTPSFLPVVVTKATFSDHGHDKMEIEVDGMRVRIEVGTDVGYVVALVRGLRQGC